MTVPFPLVPVHWLADHLTDPAIRVFDASIDRRDIAPGRAEYTDGRGSFTRGRIPGARFVDVFSELSDPAGRFPFTLPGAGQVEAFLEGAAAGVPGQAPELIIYDNAGGAWAARVWWVLRSFGWERVSVLDGDLGTWRAVGGAVESGVESGEPDAPGAVVAGSAVTDAADAASGAIAPVSLRPGRLVGVAEIRRAMGAAPLVCGINRTAFAGDSAQPRSGHIPGSVNVPLRELHDDAGGFDLAVAAAAFAGVGIDVGGDADVYLYCGGGINASGLALLLVALGHDENRVHVYDGSLNEWAADPDLPLVQGPAG